MSTFQARKNNLIYLIQTHGSQTELAKKLNSKSLTQQILSAIQRGKRALHSYEAREIEQKLGIPTGWMDHESWLKKGWRHLNTYRKLDASTKLIVDGVNKFVLSQLNPND